MFQTIYEDASYSHFCLMQPTLPDANNNNYCVFFQAALLQHVRRAVYQASLWSCSATPLTDIPSPEEYGWRKDETGWTPHWSDLPEAAKACRELLRCCCKALPLCTKKCRCHEAGLGCTTLCACEGDCDFQIIQ